MRYFTWKIELVSNILWVIVAVQISFIRSKLEYGTIRWGQSIYLLKHRKLLDQAQRGAKKLILRAINWTLTEGLESEVNIGPIDLKLDKLQRMEAIKLI